jgi:hypothetical protein
MDVLKEQCVCIKFCQKLGKTATEMYEMLQQTFGETVSPRHLNGIPNLKMAVRPLTMMIAFFDAEGLVHHEFVPQCQTMNQTVYITFCNAAFEMQFIGNGLTNGLLVPGF